VTDSRQRVIDAFLRLEAWGSSRDWLGSDPYDGLNATRLVTPLKRNPFGRRVLTQVVKRTPVDLRPLLGIRPGPSAAASAHLASAYAAQSVLPVAEAEEKLADMIDRLLAQRLPGFQEACWGYPFDVQTRVFFYPRGAPNTIATAFAGLALLDAYERTGRAELLEEAKATCAFFVRHVPQTESAAGAYFGYLVGDRTPIHNANMLVAALLARVGQVTDSSDLRRRAEAALAHTVAGQRQDGSWPYGELPHLEWVDNFHTAYVLMCIELCRRAGAIPPRETLERGLGYYRTALFLGDGTPKYYPASVYPIDAQCAAEAIRLFSLVGRRDDALRTFDFAMRKLRRRDGSFIFQRQRLWKNSQPHVRWFEAPFLAALSALIDAVQT
jgi:hypothetical protein